MIAGASRLVRGNGWFYWILQCTILPAGTCYCFYNGWFYNAWHMTWVRDLLKYLDGLLYLHAWIISYKPLLLKYCAMH